MTKTPEIILHIGHFKTGTTALQVFFDRNREQLELQGLTYARTELKLSKHSHLAFVLLRDGGVKTMLYDFKDKTRAPAMWSVLFDEARALPDGQALLVSSEEFMRLGGHAGAVDALRKVLEQAEDIKFRVIAYLRPPQSHLESWYNQLIKLKISVPAFDAAVQEVIEPVHWDYGLALKPWIDLFGPDAIILRSFDRSLREGDALFDDFMEGLGKALPVFAETPDGDPNPRLDDRLLPYVRGLDHSHLRKPLVAEMVRLAQDALAQEDQASAAIALPAPTTFAEIRQRAAVGIDTIAALPHAALDPAKMQGALPHPLSADDRKMETLVSLLAAEMGRMRGMLARQAENIARLEQQLQDTHPADDRPDETP